MRVPIVTLRLDLIHSEMHIDRTVVVELHLFLNFRVFLMNPVHDDDRRPRRPRTSVLSVPLIGVGPHVPLPRSELQIVKRQGDTGIRRLWTQVAEQDTLGQMLRLNLIDCPKLSELSSDTMLTPEQRTAIEGVLQTVLELKANARGRTLAEPFLDLPDREAWEEYYLVIPHPRCLNGIKVSHISLVSELTGAIGYARKA